MVQVLPWPACRMRVSLCCARGVASALCWFAVVVAARDRLVGGCVFALIGYAVFALVVYGCVVVVLSPVLCMAGLLPWRRLRGLMAGLSCCQVCWAVVAIGGLLQLCGGARTPSWWGVQRCCVADLVVGHGVVVYGPPRCGVCCGVVCSPSWWGVLRWCVPPLMVGRGVVVCGPFHGGACCGGVCLSAWCGVLHWCVVRLMLGRGVVVCGPTHGGACCGAVWPPSWWGMLRWGVDPLMVGSAVLG